MRRTTAQTLTTAVTAAISFDAERFDTDGFHDNAVNPTRLTVPVGLAGTYVIGCGVRYAPHATGVRATSIVLNGVTALVQDAYEPEGAIDVDIAAATAYALAEGDFVELTAFQNSGGNLNAVAVESFALEFWLVRVGT